MQLANRMDQWFRHKASLLLRQVRRQRLVPAMALVACGFLLEGNAVAAEKSQTKWQWALSPQFKGCTRNSDFGPNSVKEICSSDFSKSVPGGEVLVMKCEKTAHPFEVAFFTTEKACLYVLDHYPQIKTFSTYESEADAIVEPLRNTCSEFLSQDSRWPHISAVTAIAKKLKLNADLVIDLKLKALKCSIIDNKVKARSSILKSFEEKVPEMVSDSDQFGPIFLSIMLERIDALEALLERGAEPEVVYTHMGGTFPLYVAATLCSDGAIKALHAHGATMNQIHEKYGTTAMMAAASACSPKLVRWMIENGASLRANGKDAKSVAEQRLKKARSSNENADAREVLQIFKEAMSVDPIPVESGDLRDIVHALVRPGTSSFPWTNANKLKNVRWKKYTEDGVLHKKAAINLSSPRSSAARRRNSSERWSRVAELPQSISIDLAGKSAGIASIQISSWVPGREELADVMIRYLAGDAKLTLTPYKCPKWGLERSTLFVVKEAGQRAVFLVAIHEVGNGSVDYGVSEYLTFYFDKNSFLESLPFHGEAAPTSCAIEKEP